MKSDEQVRTILAILSIISQGFAIFLILSKRIGIIAFILSMPSESDFYILSENDFTLIVIFIGGSIILNVVLVYTIISSTTVSEKSKDTYYQETPAVTISSYDEQKEIKDRQRQLIQRREEEQKQLEFFRQEEKRIVQELSQLQHSSGTENLVSLLLDLKSLPGLSQEAATLLENFTNHTDTEVRDISERILLKYRYQKSFSK